MLPSINPALFDTTAPTHPGPTQLVLPKKNMNFRSRIPVSEVSQTSVSHVPVTQAPSTFYKFHRQLDTNPFFNNGLHGRTTHAANLFVVGCNQQNLFKQKREANIVIHQLKQGFHLKEIKLKILNWKEQSDVLLLYLVLCLEFFPRVAANMQS